MSTVDDISDGDTTPKLARASIKDIALIVNRISHTFKTPDAMVAPDALELNDSGNLALGGAALAQSAVGRHFLVMNNSSAGGTIAHTNLLVQSTSGLSFLGVKTADRASGLRYWDGSSAATPMVEMAWYPQEFVWRHRVYNGTTQSTALKISNTGQIGITENVSFQTLLNVGTVGASTTNELWVASNTTNFEGAFLGAYDNRSGAKLDLNSQANSTNVSSWRLSHDYNDGGQGRLSFRFAPAATTRGALTYVERMALTTSGISFNGGNRSVGGAIRYMQLENTAQASLSMVRNTNDASGPVLVFGKTRGTTNGSATIVQDGDQIGAIQWAPANGVHVDAASAYINGLAVGTQSATSTPGILTFGTTAVGQTGATEAMRITNQQNVSIGAASDVARLVVMKGTLYTSGENLIYLQSSAPASLPVLITGSSSGKISISGGSPLSSGGARGGQIDLVAGGASTYPGHVFLRTGLNADGLPGSQVFTFTPTGQIGNNTLVPEHRIHSVGNPGERTRVMMQAYGEYNGFTSRRANGTAAAPTKVLANEPLAFFNTHAYTGTTYIAGGQISITAEADWSDTATPSQIQFAPGHPTDLGQITRVVFTAGGKVGINSLSPAAVFTVGAPYPASTTSAVFEVDPDPTNGFVQIRSYDRTTAFYKGMATAASSFVWGVGGASGTNVITMALTTAGNLVVGGNNPATYTNGTGTGVATIDGQFIIAPPSANTTAMCVTVGEKYAGFKLKIGPANTQNGGVDYFDFTTRPGWNGVGSNADYTMIRMESALSKTNPDMYLQTSGAGGRVIVGGSSATSAARLNVIAASGGGSVAAFTGLTTSQIAADIIVSRGGASTSTTAGMGSSIQLSNGTNGTHVMFQEYESGLQLFNVIGGNWYERMYMHRDGTFVVGAHISAAGYTSETMQVIGKLTGGNEYCYFAQANTGNAAYAMRMQSMTSNSTVGDRKSVV